MRNMRLHGLKLIAFIGVAAAPASRGWAMAELTLVRGKGPEGAAARAEPPATYPELLRRRCGDRQVVARRDAPGCG
ncbi:MAG: hypothetical protein JNK82_33780 [Myxococcaceae bacterium]|nr:hypothetical protein [Myxococcaceae bacterium]